MRAGLPRTSRLLIPALVAIMLTATPSMSALAAHHYPTVDAAYHDYGEMVADIRAVQAAHPDIVRIASIGTSYKGRTIWVVEVSDHPGVDEGEPEVLFDALHHAREHLTPEMALYTLHLLADQYGRDTDLGKRVTRLVDTRRIWIIPMVNPDGLDYDLSGGPYGDGFRGWRKNRQPTPGSRYVGTDLNRNYGYDWARKPGAQAFDYPGPKAFSAPETRAVRDFVLSRRRGGLQRIRTHITFHTTGQLVMWPYSRDSTNIPPDMTALDHATLVAMGKAMAALNGYRPVQSGDLGRKPGTLIDWMYGSQRVFSFTFEMYPKTATADSFYPPTSVITRETRRNRDAVLYLIDMADCPYRAVGGSEADCGPLYDDMEIDRAWNVDADGTDTATAGAWQRGVPAAGGRQLGTAVSGQSMLVTGRQRGADVDGGHTTIRSRFVALPSDQDAALRLRYWVGLSSGAGPGDGLRVEVVARDGSIPAFLALDIRGTGASISPAWARVSRTLPAAFRGKSVAVLLTATDSAGDATVEAGVDDVRITLPTP